MDTVRQRIERLRAEMRKRGITVYIVPSSDPHESEYVCAHFQARAYITGFTGSAGTAVITLDEAGLWTDGRYFVQAEKQLAGSGIKLFQSGESGVPTVEEYVKGKLLKGQKLAFDGRTMSAKTAEKFAKLAKESGAEISMGEDLIDLIWQDRPPIPDDEKIWILGEAYSGESTQKKLSRVRAEMEKAGAELYVLASLTDIAWLLNVRGGDIPHVPVTLSFLTVGKEKCTLYVRPSVVTEEVRAYLKENGVELQDYGRIYEDLRQYSGGAVMMDKKNVNALLWNCVPGSVKKLDTSNPTELMKAVKNPVELTNLRRAHHKESLAFTKFIYWLKTQVGKEKITEISAGKYLDSLRREMDGYLQQSFGPICAYGEHGAIVHYSASEETDARIHPEGFLLVDAGGHYLEGTTDSTRTIAVGPLTFEQKHLYTAVLKGNLRLADTKFLEGVCGMNLDILCREPLWKLGLDYRHGTGHGVGHLLNVHEEPNALRWKILPETTCAALRNSVLKPGMVTTDEPGVYLEGQFGIRLENELLCVEDERTEYGQFLRFDVLTLIPFDLDAVLPEELSAEEKMLLNAYHRRVYEELSGDLTQKEREWLAAATRPVK